jgi:hypothetical protein
MGEITDRSGTSTYGDTSIICYGFLVRYGFFFFSEMPANQVGGPPNVWVASEYSL